MTKSKKIRAYLAKHPEAGPKDLQTRFNCSISMAYRLIQEAKKTAQEIGAPDGLENATTMQRMLEDAKNLASSSNGLHVDIFKPIDAVNHPPHYKIGGIETIDFIEAKGLDNHYHLANAIKYISRAPYKNNYLEDVKKAAWYLQREIERHENPSFLR